MSPTPHPTLLFLLFPIFTSRYWLQPECGVVRSITLLSLARYINQVSFSFFLASQLGDIFCDWVLIWWLMPPYELN